MKRLLTAAVGVPIVLAALFYLPLKALHLIVLPFPHRINYLLTIASLRRRSIGE